MSLFQGLRRWLDGGTDGAGGGGLVDGDTSAFVVSFVVHLLLLVSLGLLPVWEPAEERIVVVSSLAAPEEIEQLTVPEEFYFSEQPSIEVGANSLSGAEMALSEAPIVSDLSIVPLHADVTDTLRPELQVNNVVAVASGLHFHKNLAVRGAAGEGTTGATGAIDRLTHEILLSLEERQTLVIWMFDQTASLIPQRKAIHDRFDRIYEELGIIEAAGATAFARHEEQPLLSTVVAFGKGLTLMTKEPTDNLDELKKAVKTIPNDNSGDEHVFAAIHEMAKRNADYRYVSAATEQPKRNVMIVVFTDEAGSDERLLDETVKMCRRWTMPVFVVGVPAPFGKRETQMKWVDPDPNYDQSAQWGVVDQGPESLMLEQIKLGFSGQRTEEEPTIDSGFGPYALTRLCVETGGIYFAVHPNRDVRRRVTRGEVAAFSSHLERFFDPETMRRYRPEYVSAREYAERAKSNAARSSLLTAASRSQIEQMIDPRTRFVKRDEGQLAADLTEAQQAAAALEPKINALYEVLKNGEKDREKETTPRWQAGYDLAMGRVLAVKVRTEGYNQILAAAKRGLKFKQEKNNTWVLAPSNEITVGSQMVKMAERARMYLERVVKEHPGTPWAMLAERELKDPMGWAWKEAFTDLNPPRNMVAANNNNNAPAAARNDQKAMLNKPPPKRPPPKL